MFGYWLWIALIGGLLLRHTDISKITSHSRRKLALLIPITCLIIYLSLFQNARQSTIVYRDTERTTLELEDNDTLTDIIPITKMNSSKMYQNLICPKPTVYVGRQYISRLRSNVQMKYVEADNPDVGQGGWHKPDWCNPKRRLAIIIPYRNREKQLIYLLKHLHPILQRQHLDYVIFVAEQNGTETFNKGMIMNIAFKEALNLMSFDCIVFHDVDMIPEDDRIPYCCSDSDKPQHLSVAVNEFGYKLPYGALIGGVFQIPTKDFLKVNGYSNMYWGWGSEDDDMYYRLSKSKLKLTRPPAEIARYTMLYHIKGKRTRRNLALLYRGSMDRREKDGVNSLKYKIVSTVFHKLYTHFLIDIGKMPRESTKENTSTQPITMVTKSSVNSNQHVSKVYINNSTNKVP